MAILPNPDDRVTREAGAKALTDAGYPTSPSTLATKVSRGRGPRYRLYSGRAIYVWSDLLAWAESCVTEPRRSSSEADARRVAPADSIGTVLDACTEHHAIRNGFDDGGRNPSP
jgi:hypothetical protein